jgi:hypothetical protein
VPKKYDDYFFFFSGVKLFFQFLDSSFKRFHGFTSVLLKIAEASEASEG